MCLRTLKESLDKLNGQEGNITAIIFTLKTLGKSRGYVERQEVTGAEGKPVETKITEIVIRKEVDGETAE